MYAHERLAQLKKTTAVYQPEEAQLIKKPGQFVYYDVNIAHDDFARTFGAPTPARYFEVRTTPIFEGKPTDYSASIVRFTVPTQVIPIQIFPIQPNNDEFKNTDINKSLYSITLSWNGFDRQEYLIWNTEDLTAQVPPTTSTTDIIYPQYWQYYALYSLEHFTRMINTALSAATTYLITNHAMPLTAAPFFTYDATTALFTLNAPAAFLNSALLPISIFMNSPLYTNFINSMDVVRYSYPALGTVGKNVQLNVYNTVTNSVTLPAPYGLTYKMLQEYNAIANMIAFTSLIVISGSMPLRPEWITRQRKLGDAGTVSLGNNFYKILADFEVLVESGFETRRYVHYVPSAEYRRLTFETDDPVNVVDVQFYWKDNFDNLYEVLIPAHDVATLKFLFEKR